MDAGEGGTGDAVKGPGRTGSTVWLQTVMVHPPCGSLLGPHMHPWPPSPLRCQSICSPRSCSFPPSPVPIHIPTYSSTAPSLIATPSDQPCTPAIHLPPPPYTFPPRHTPSPPAIHIPPPPPRPLRHTPSPSSAIALMTHSPGTIHIYQEDMIPLCPRGDSTQCAVESLTTIASCFWSWALIFSHPAGMLPGFSVFSLVRSGTILKLPGGLNRFGYGDGALGIRIRSPLGKHGPGFVRGTLNNPGNV